MYKFFSYWTRKLHRWVALLTAIPLLLVIATGLLLQVKKQVTWVQPKTMKGSGSEPVIGWDLILSAAKSDPSSAVQSWDDIERLDVRPDRGLVKVQARNHWELQLDLGTGKILASNYRRSDWIEQLHDGSFFSEGAKLGIFLPNGILLLGLWITGMYLWYLPFLARARKKKLSTNSGPSK